MRRVDGQMLTPVVNPYLYGDATQYGSSLGTTMNIIPIGQYLPTGIALSTLQPALVN